MAEFSPGCCPTPGCGQQVGSTESMGAGLKICGRCRQVAYCSRNCQKAAWKRGHKKECEALQARGAEERRQRVYKKLADRYNGQNYKEIVPMAKEGLEVAGELQKSGQPELAALIYCMLGESFTGCCQYVKGMELMQLAKTLAVDADDRPMMAKAGCSIGLCHWRQGEHSKAVAECEQARALFLELGDRRGESVACSALGVSFMSMEQYDKAIALLEQCLAIREELGDRAAAEDTRLNIGRCLSRDGQNEKAVVYFKQVWAFEKQRGNAKDQVRVAKFIGEARWQQARAEHHEAAADANTCGAVGVAGSDTLQDAEKWLRMALDLATKAGYYNYRMDVEINLACLAMFKGDEAEAVELLSQHLQGWLDDLGPRTCAGCLQLRGEDAPMLSCDVCRVARYCNAAHQRLGWRGENETFSYGMPHKAICPLLKQWRLQVAKGKVTAVSAGLREEMVAFLQRRISCPPTPRKGSCLP